MNSLPQPYPVLRAPRVRPAERTPVVLRTDSGARASAQLEVVSLTGGLLSLSDIFDRGSRVKMMFLTATGPVMAAVEMLTPSSWTQQPFRFLALSSDEQRRLRALTSAPGPSTPADTDWVEKYRSAVQQQDPPRRRLKAILASLTISAICLVSLFYALRLR